MARIGNEANLILKLTKERTRKKLRDLLNSPDWGDDDFDSPGDAYYMGLSDGVRLFEESQNEITAELENK